MNTINKVVFVTLLTFIFSLSTLVAQTDTLYLLKYGAVVGKFNVHTEVDSIIFYKPASLPYDTIRIEMVNIPAGTFTMGSPRSEVNRNADEIPHTVTLSAFSMSKYEITNAQYAIFLNTKGIGSDGKYAAGDYPSQTLIYETKAGSDWGLHYNDNVDRWIPVKGYENHPVVNVSWYGATEFALFVGCTLPFEAQWEYACRAGTTTPFNTGDLLTDQQANYNWAYPYNDGTNTVTTSPGKTMAVGSFPANAWGLHDMHGNVWEWCYDRYGEYLTWPQTNPTGPTSGSFRVHRGGGYNNYAETCRSAIRYTLFFPGSGSTNLGFRVAYVIY